MFHVLTYRISSSFAVRGTCQNRMWGPRPACWGADPGPALSSSVAVQASSSPEALLSLVVNGDDESIPCCEDWTPGRLVWRLAPSERSSEKSWSALPLSVFWHYDQLCSLSVAAPHFRISFFRCCECGRQKSCPDLCGEAQRSLVWGSQWTRKASPQHWLLLWDEE